MRSNPILFCLLLVASGALKADPVAVSAVNEIRQAVGLGALTESQSLHEAAQAHASYLQRYIPPGSEQSASAHEERAGVPEFSGHLAPDRALSFGYAHTQVTENVSLGNPDIRDSVNDLMSAIYHRFAFLDFTVDEIGAASAGQSYVYNMGRKNLLQACLQQPETAMPSLALDCLGTPIKVSAFESMCGNLPQKALFDQPFKGRCANGTMLNRRYMEAVCQTPPAGALFDGSGRYYNLCSNGKRIDARWFDAMCEAPSGDAAYRYSGSAYKICTPEVSVHAEWFQNYCASVPESDQYRASGAYYEVCDNGFKISAEYYEELAQEMLLMQPLAVIWPANGVSGIKPVFYTEEPHPTPDLAMTGYPVSIQFNPRWVKSAVIAGFSLEHFNPDGVADWQAVPALRRIDQSNDINQRFSALEFAWFPLQRLVWGGKYRYRIDALVDGELKNFEAEFETQKLNLPVYQLQGGEKSLQVASRQFVLYRPPDLYDDLPFQGISLKYRNRPFVEADVIDSNTVAIRAGGRGCSPVYLSTRLGEELEIIFCQKKKWSNLF